MSAAAVLTAETDRDAWLEARRGYLGGTDIAAIVGKHKYKTACDVYLEKTGEPVYDETKTKLAEAGLALEPYIRQWSIREFGWDIKPGRTITHPDHPFLAVNPDGFVGDDACWECKTYRFTTKKEWGAEGTDEIPDAYYIQGIWQCGIAGLRRTLFTACDTGLMTLTPYQAEEDPRNFELLVEAGVRFWNEHIVPRIPPALTDKDGHNIPRLYPKTTGEVLVSSPKEDEIAMRMKELYAQLGPMKKEYESLKESLKVAIGEAYAIETAVGTFKSTPAPGQVSWKNVACEFSPGNDLIEKFRGAPFRKLMTPFRGGD